MSSAFRTVQPIFIGDENEVAADETCVVIGPIILYPADVLRLRDWLTAALPAMLPESLRDSRAVLERGGMLNYLLEQRNEMARLLRYILNYSNSRVLLSEGFIEDANLVLGNSGRMVKNDPYLYEKFKESFREHCDRHDPEASEYDWLKGFGRLWRDAIDAARSQSDGAEHG